MLTHTALFAASPGPCRCSHPLHGASSRPRTGVYLPSNLRAGHTWHHDAYNTG